jgi:hypothetical protein
VGENPSLNISFYRLLRQLINPKRASQGYSLQRSIGGVVSSRSAMTF